MTKQIAPLTLIFSLLVVQCVMPQQGINPLSKITITSNRATCQKDQSLTHQFVFNYQENVKVTFADQSTITSDTLEVLFEGRDLGKALPFDHKKTTRTNTPKNNAKNPSLQKFKKIIFSGKVTFANQNRTAKAEKAELLLSEHMCILSGNVSIHQKKTTAKEVPITIESDEAKLNLITDELCFSGSIHKPVNTIISLEDYEPLKKTKKSKRKKKKRHE